jgi:hypothetical protein
VNPSTVLAVILAFPRPVTPPAYDPEPPSDYEARAVIIAEAVARVAGSRSEAAAVLVVWEAESRFLLQIHDGTIKGDGGRATCMGSIHPHVPDWGALAGTDSDSTERCATRTAQHLRWGLGMCGAREIDHVAAMAAAFEYYARGHCHAPGAESKRRARQWARVRVRLQ